MKKLIPLSFVVASMAFASAYKIPEQSLNSTALAGAYVSHTTSADTAYFNPANMVFLDDGKFIELNLMGIHLTSVKNETTGNETKEESFLLPQIFAISKKLGDWRIGFSLIEPGGLSKQWGSAPENWSAKKFELRVIEANPVFSYKVNEKFAIGGGLRFIYTEGTIDLAASPKPSPDVNMEADGKRFGYNLALSYKALPELGLAVTYRSKVDLKEEGDITFPNGFTALNIPAGFTTPANVTVPLPATLSLATDYAFNKQTTVELEYERVYWSSYKRLTIFAPQLSGGIYTDKPKNWKDTNTFRIGITHKYNSDITLMAGFAYDETPVPDETLGYELPDSDANIFSLGLRYKVSSSTEIGLAYLYDKKDSRSVTNDNMIPNTTTFSGAEAHLLSFGIGFRY